MLAHMQNSFLHTAWNLHISTVIISLITSIVRKTAEKEYKINDDSLTLQSSVDFG